MSHKSEYPRFNPPSVYAFTTRWPLTSRIDLLLLKITYLSLLVKVLHGWSMSLVTVGAKPSSSVSARLLCMAIQRIYLYIIYINDNKN